MTWSDMNMWLMGHSAVVFPHTRGHGSEGSCRWSNEKHSIGRDGEDYISGVSGEGGGLPLRLGACRGALWTPAGAGRGVIVLHGCLFTMVTGLASGAHPLHAALGCSSRVSSDPRLWGTSNAALISHNAGPEGALGKTHHIFFWFFLVFFCFKG